MNKTKLVLWLIVLAFLGLVIFQNQAFFMGKQSLGLNLWIFNAWTSQELPVAVIAMGFFVFGLIMAYLFGLPGRFHARKTIKRLNATVASQSEEVEKLKKEIDTLKGVPATEGETPLSAIPADAGDADSGETKASQDHSSNPAENADEQTNKH
jgi:uncharacterized integral membrane protein